MSEAGKVSLPTVERIAEIKATSDEFWIKADSSRGLETHLSSEVFALCEFISEALAALKKEQNRVILKDMTIRSLENQLAEAQQTIARQSAALGWYELGKPELARAALGEGVCCSNPNIQTFNNEFVSNTRCCLNCGRLVDVPVFSTPNCPECGSNNVLAHPNKAGIWLCVPCNQVFREGAKES